MPALILRRLGVQSFRSYVEPQELVFEQTGLHLISAPSGYGKTALMQAIAFALRYPNEPPATEHQSWPWLTTSPMAVELSLLNDLTELEIRRGQKPLLRVGDAPAITSAKTIEAEFPLRLGIDPKVLKALTYRPQKQGGFFLSKTDSEKKAFLTEVLSLGRLEEEVAATTANVGRLEKDRALAEARLEQAKKSFPPKPEEPVAEELPHSAEEVERLAQYVATLTASLALQKQDLEKAKRALEAQAAKAGEQYEATISELQNQMALIGGEKYAADATLLASIDKTRGRLSWLQNAAAKEREEHQRALGDKSRAVVDLRATLADLRAAIAQKQRVEADLAKADSALASLQSHVCYTCHRPWQDEAATRENIEQIEKSIAAFRARLAEIGTAEANQAQVEAQLVTLREERDALQARAPVSAKIEAAIEEYRTKLADLEAQRSGAEAAWRKQHDSDTWALQLQLNQAVAEQRAAVSAAGDPAILSQRLAAIQNCQTDIFETKTQLESARAQNKLAETRNAAAKSAYASSLCQWQALNDAVVAAEKAVADIAAAVSVEDDFLQLVKSFLALVFDETLQLVAARANELLEGTPNVQGMTLDFVSERETQAKTVKQEIRPIIRLDGHEIPLRGCSGGQLSTIEIAVDLALGTVIGERTGVRPSWLFLDEPFDGLDAASRESVVSMLSKIAEHRAVYVIDHGCVTKELFASVISVTCDEHRSRLVQ